MISAINSSSGFSITTAYQNIQSNIKSLSSSRQRNSSGISSRTSYSTHALNTVLSNFLERTEKLYQAVSSFEFSSKNQPQYFRTAGVSDSDKVSAKALEAATPQNYLLTIDRLATAKSYKSNRLWSDETTDLEEGTYTFNVTIENTEDNTTTEYTRSITIDTSGTNPDSNKDVFQKLKYAIESTDDAIEAVLTETEEKKYSTLSDTLTATRSYLTIRNKETDGNMTFRLTDETGDIVETLNLDQDSQVGKKSFYTLNSASSSSAANTISLDNDNLSITFLDIDDDVLKIKVEQGLKPVEEKLRTLIASYNDYIDWLDQSSQYISSVVKNSLIKNIDAVRPGNEDINSGSSLRTSLQRLTSGIRIDDITTIPGKLASIGLEFSSEGKLEITEKFSSALENNFDSVKDALAGDKGVFTKMNETLATILENDVSRYGRRESEYTTYSQQGYANSLLPAVSVENRLSLFV